MEWIRTARQSWPCAALRRGVQWATVRARVCVCVCALMRNRSGIRRGWGVGERGGRRRSGAAQNRRGQKTIRRLARRNCFSCLPSTPRGGSTACAHLQNLSSETQILPPAQRSPRLDGGTRGARLSGLAGNWIWTRASV